MSKSYMIDLKTIDNSKVTIQEYQRNLWYQKNLIELGLTVPYDSKDINYSIEDKLIMFSSYGEYDLAKMQAQQYLDNNMEVPAELRIKLIKEKENLKL